MRKHQMWSKSKLLAVET